MFFGEGQGDWQISESDIRYGSSHIFNLTVWPGEFVAIVGESGSGKSTLMNILNGIYKPNHGKIYYKGKKVSIRSPRHAVDMGIGMVHQHFRLIPTLTAAENVFLYMPDCKLILNKKEMEEQIGKWSSEFHLNVDPSALIWQLSVGEQQRVEIVKLLCRGAEILILDEPTAGLDPQGRDDILDQVKRLHEERHITVILVSHSMEDVAKYVDRIIVMNKGEVLMDQIPKEVFKRYKELEEVGLAAPQVTYIMHALKDKGMPVSADATTIEEARLEILHALHR